MATVIFASSHASISAPAIPAIDKIAHFAVFGLLATHFVRSPRLHKNPWLAVVAVSLFGVADEWHQSNVPGRSCDALDWLADTLGAALATSLHEHAPFYRRMLDFRIQLKVPLRAQ